MQKYNWEDPIKKFSPFKNIISNSEADQINDVSALAMMAFLNTQILNIKICIFDINQIW
jgi:hypothetical protein